MTDITKIKGMEEEKRKNMERPKGPVQRAASQDKEKYNDHMLNAWPASGYTGIEDKVGIFRKIENWINTMA